MLSPLYGQLSPLRVPTKAAFDPQSIIDAYIAAVEAADGQSLEQGVKDAYSDFITGCVNDGIWNAIKAACILAGARTLGGSLVPLVGSEPTNNNFVSGDYNRENGLKATSAIKYLDSNRNNNLETQDDRHLSCYVHTAQTSGTGTAYLGGGVTNSGTSHFGRSGANPANLFARNASSTTDTITGKGAATGFLGMSRNSSTGFDFRASGATSNYSRASQAPFNANVYVFRTNNALQSDARLSFYSIGQSIDLALLDNRVSTLMTDIAAAI